MQPNSLPPVSQPLRQLPLVLIEQGAQGAELWAGGNTGSSLLDDLEQRLHQHRGLLLTGGAGTGKTTCVGNCSMS